MVRIISGFMFYLFYSVMYLLPFVILFFVAQALNLDLRQYLDRSGVLKLIFLILFVLYAMLLPGYRAKLAANAYGERDMSLIEAHSVSGAIVRAHMSYLPIIGRFYEKKD
jgi:hypothetical protein